MHFLNVNRTFHFKSLQNRRFVILLSASQFFYNTCFFKFSFEFLQRFFNVFAFFYWYYNHVFKIKYVVIKLFRSQFAAQNYTYFLYLQNFPEYFIQKSKIKSTLKRPFLADLLFLPDRFIYFILSFTP